jgi:hypothetical protein
MHTSFIAHEADHRMAELHATAALARRRRAGAPVSRRRLPDLRSTIAGIVSRIGQVPSRPGAGSPCTSARAAATSRATSCRPSVATVVHPQ